ncbi:hypothetical protein ACH47B_27030 [Rhodococcus sp. NPDC019627]|uniref:hypothetical protein n=1 Tax=unclassified Rhodococcus (in: high G+C Gram-positive bacteria) TaxID=192944 RepID=UPI003411BFDD
MSTEASARSSLATRIDSLSAALMSAKYSSVGGFIREMWWTLRPVVLFAAHVALLTFVLGFSRWAALGTVRGDISEAGTSHPTLLSIVDACDAVMRAAEAIGSSSVAASSALWTAWIAALLAAVFTAVSIRLSQRQDMTVTSSLARPPRRLVREVFAVLLACAILAQLAGEPSHLVAVPVWESAVVIAFLMWTTVYAERRWMVPPKRYTRLTELPVGTPITIGRDARALDPLADRVVGAATGTTDTTR